MEQLEHYIINSNGTIYLSDIDYKSFNYESYDDFELDLYFLIECLYSNYKIYKNKQERVEQEQFRRDLINKYGKCIITGSTCLTELEAAHIVEFYKNNNNNTISNGLLLKSNIHKTFDEYLWTINPKTLMIEVKENVEVGEIKKYEGIKINIDVSMIDNLRKRYNNFESS